MRKLSVAQEEHNRATGNSALDDFPTSNSNFVPTNLETTNSDSTDETPTSYAGTRIPWYVRTIWVCYWVLAALYLIAVQLPQLRQ